MARRRNLVNPSSALQTSSRRRHRRRPHDPVRRGYRIRLVPNTRRFRAGPKLRLHLTSGNTLSDASGKTYTWDFENRLIRAVVPGQNGGTTTFK
jgi:predicted acyl esterase